MGRLFRPVYGEHFEVRPTHWWNPKQRKTAKIAAKLADYHATEIYDEVRQQMTEQLLYGASFSRPRWHRLRRL